MGAKIENMAHGRNRRYVVSNMSGDPQGIYHGFYVQRGEVPESPIGELKNGLSMDRLSFHHFRANAMKLLEHAVAYALVVLHREATAHIPEVARAEVHTLRLRLWKVGALVKTSCRRIWFHFSETWPHQHLWVSVHQALTECVRQLPKSNRAPPLGLDPLPM